MANQEHLDILKRGTNAWNQWRQKYRNTRPDLRFADLQSINLDRVYLSFADIEGANGFAQKPPFAQKGRGLHIM